MSQLMGYIKTNWLYISLSTQHPPTFSHTHALAYSEFSSYDVTINNYIQWSDLNSITQFNSNTEIVMYHWRQMGIL